MKLLNLEGKEVDKIDFGIVDVGTTKKVSYTIKNDEGTYIDNIKVELDDIVEKKEISIADYQTSLGKDGTANLTIAWTPTLEVKRKLELSFKIKYRRVWG